MKKTNKVLKLAIVGGGLGSAVGYTHLIASQMDHRWKIVAGCFSRDKKINEDTVKSWNLEGIRLHYNWKELLEGEVNKIDAVVILTPTPNHYEMVSYAIDCGHYVICEKSLTTNLKEALSIKDKIIKQNGYLAVTFNYTGYPMVRELKNTILLGKLGQINQIHIEMPQESFARLGQDRKKPTPQSWRLKDYEIPSVSLDLGSHAVQMIEYLISETPDYLYATQSSYGWFSEVIDDVSSILHFKSGCKAVIWYGKSAIGHRNGLRVRVYGSEGSAEWYQMEPEFLHYYDIYGCHTIIDRGSHVTVANQDRYNRFKSGHPAGFLEAFANIYVDIADQILNKNSSVKSNGNITEAISNLKTLEMINISANEKKPIQFSEKNEKNHSQ